MVETKESTIGQSVAGESNSLDEFEAFGIDFCCGGNRSIQDDYEQKGLYSDEFNQAFNNL